MPLTPELARLARRFWAKVRVPRDEPVDAWPFHQPRGKCWLWMGRVSRRSGYGQIRVGARMQRAHRVAYVLAKHQIAVGLVVCHACDNRRCVRPSHLFLGTASVNMRDMEAKGRTFRPYGETNGNAHVEAEKIAWCFQLRAQGLTQRAIAQFLHVSQGHVSRILRRIQRTEG